MDRTATITTTIDAGVKDALARHCEKKGLKLRFFIEQAIVDALEDELDLEAYLARRDEPEIPLQKYLKQHAGK